MEFTGASLLAALALASSFPGTLALGAGNATAVANGTYLDENDFAGSLNKEVEGLMFGLGVCSFNVDSLVGLGLDDRYSWRTINPTVKRASHGNKRVVLRKLLCENANADDPVIEDDIDEHVKSEENAVQGGEEAAQNEKAAAEEEVAATGVEGAESDEKLAGEDIAQAEEDANANAT
ncbi:hypothetical protein DL766_006190 [Monosporascus sp. MC13-8B]|uniref:Uncharacterized protein n=1 Tax=Monosporascus cannonballus TaxID=155416 RepID=A0ABY0GWG8_9PEZI|nr:hypothetical protein DL762_008544 [Monosporascus cannonballus]RYO79701.1 hypothetical protein DL763_009171 [Monosporascus cannonballus]RYP27815.1 hypothetical protein DL766_006190 [Monosporascus sp. MC13-8B]